MSSFENKEITVIKPMGGLAAGQPKSYQLWVTGGVISVTKETDVALVEEILEEFKQLVTGMEDGFQNGELFEPDKELRSYLRYRLMEEGW